MAKIKMSMMTLNDNKFRMSSNYDNPTELKRLSEMLKQGLTLQNDPDYQTAVDLY